MSTLQDEPLLLTHCAHAHCLQFEHSGNGLMPHIRETSKVTINTSYFHPVHQHYTDEAQKAETVPSVYIYTAICIQAQTANIFARLFTFETGRLPLETEMFHCSCDVLQCKA